MDLLLIYKYRTFNDEHSLRIYVTILFFFFLTIRVQFAANMYKRKLEAVVQLKGALLCPWDVLILLFCLAKWGSTFSRIVYKYHQSRPLGKAFRVSNKNIIMMMPAKKEYSSAKCQKSVLHFYILLCEIFYTYKHANSSFRYIFSLLSNLTNDEIDNFSLGCPIPSAWELVFSLIIIREQRARDRAASHSRVVLGWSPFRSINH